MIGPKSCCYVYFLRPIGEDGPVKVGYSIYPARRLAEYLKWSPLVLEIAAQIEFIGEACHRQAMRLERQLHQRYVGHHMHHEWFAAHPLLTRDIERIAEGTFAPWSLPEPAKTNITRYANLHAITLTNSLTCATLRIRARADSEAA